LAKCSRAAESKPILCRLPYAPPLTAPLRCSPDTVAMKFIPKHGKTEKDLKSLRQEIGILSNLSHPNIIKMIEYFETKTEFCVVTEYAHGELFEILEDDGKPSQLWFITAFCFCLTRDGAGKLPEAEVRRVATQLVHALQYLHKNRSCIARVRCMR
jgi:serine/threonine protein kinase